MSLNYRIHLSYSSTFTFFFHFTQDYPSVGQIVNKIKEKAVSIIFAITEDQFDIYEQLSNIIEGSTVGVLANDSSNIVKLIEENYDVSRMTSKGHLE